MPGWLCLLAAAAAVALLVRLIGPIVVSNRTPPMQVAPGTDSATLVVALHGFDGRSRKGAATLARTAYPNAHLLAPLYLEGMFKAFSNQSPFTVADVLETTIDEAYRTHKYTRIVLIGHSMGGSMLRKAFVWGCGQEDDRPGACRGKHDWTAHVERFVSLASISRGWSLTPKPRNMTWYGWLASRLGIRLAKLSGTGRLLFDMQRGAPFVANLRVQWIRLARLSSAGPRLPYVIHLLGTEDDIAAPDDVKDVQAAKGFKYRTLSNTSHYDIATALSMELNGGQPTTSRAKIILEAATLPFEEIITDSADPFVEEASITRVLFILHGIRDYNYWGKELETHITAALGSPSDTAVVVPKYGHFPMMPFLLWADRQQKVRWFMDVYTETLAQYPHAVTINFVGHSTVLTFWLALSSSTERSM